jgi:hypothetical protein
MVYMYGFKSGPEQKSGPVVRIAINGQPSAVLRMRIYIQALICTSMWIRIQI